MGLSAGIVGLPNVGKSTLFNAITDSQVEAANYPFATINPNVGVVEVPDERVDKIAKIFQPKKIINATFALSDIAGLVKGASAGEGLGNQFLGHIREVDAILHIFRCFEDENITHVEQGVDPIRDIEIINLELIMADLQTVENRISKVERKAKSQEREAVKEYDCLVKLHKVLVAGQSVRDTGLTKEEIEIVQNFHLLTIKPVVYIANLGEDEINDYQNNVYYQKVEAYLAGSSAQLIPICAKLEAELGSLDQAGKTEFLKELGIEESGLAKIVRTAYQTLGLRTYFTAGTPEVRAWTFKDGMKAPQCAGIIHSDFEKGFIKAECYNYQDLMSCGSEIAVKEKGLFRIEGKEYLVQDGDILHFRFNV